MRPHSTWVTLLLCLPLLLPLAALLRVAVGSDASAWPDLLRNVLPGMAVQTFLLLAGVGVLTLIIGTCLAWIVTVYEFPGRALLQWTAILPLALPSYIVSFVAVDTLSYAGPVQTALRSLVGWTSPAETWFPEIRSLPGAIVVMSLVLYPYVYMTARLAFLRLPRSQIDAARLLGRKRTTAFFQIALPQARAALAVGVSLVLMETLNDIGAVGFFGVNTVTLGIYSLWLGQGNLGAAAQLALLLLFCVAALITFEQFMRRRADMAKASRNSGTSDRARLHGWRLALILITGFTPVLFGFVAPVAMLFNYADNHWASAFNSSFASAASNSLFLAIIAALITVAIALLFVYSNWRNDTSWLRRLTRVASLGYGIPGTVLAIGILVAFGTIDRWLNGWSKAMFDTMPGLLLSGTMMALAFAHVTRFLAIAAGSVNAGMDKISPNLGEAARTLGRNPGKAFREVHMPLLVPAMLTGGLMVFVDSLKELPATLLLRPFDFETLSTHVFALASLGQLEDSAVPALLIVLIGLLPVAVLARGLRDA